jgi:hypothetical protein
MGGGDRVDDTTFYEALANLAHEQWSGWMDYFIGNCQEKDDGSLTVPAGYVAALRRQMTTPYHELSEAEKDSDRKEADKIIELLCTLEAP